MDKIKKMVNKIIHFCNRNKYIKNIYGTTYNKKALIVYLVSAFDSGTDMRHSNKIECKTFGILLKELGYNVDVINLNSTRKIRQKYNVIVGMGEAFENLFYRKGTNTKFIFYATGCCPLYSNMMSTLKARDFYEKKNELLLGSIRKISYTQDFQIFLSDKVIVLGNDFVKETYLYYDTEKSRYENLAAFYFDIKKPIIENKNIQHSRKEFVWFGSLGALHKGLDILIDYFMQNSDYKLHICGLSLSEHKFLDFYKKKTKGLSNIIFHNFVPIDSEKFDIIMNKISFVIFPSLSEGGSPALLNVIANGGVIPIYSTQCGVDFNDNYGFELKTISLNSIQEAVGYIETKSDEQIKKMTLDVLKFVRENYTYSEYKNNLRNILKKALNNDSES